MPKPVFLKNRADGPTVKEDWRHRSGAEGKRLHPGDGLPFAGGAFHPRHRPINRSENAPHRFGAAG